MRWMPILLTLMLAGCSGPSGEETDATADAGTDPGNDAAAAAPVAVPVVDQSYQWYFDDIDDVPGGTMQEPAWFAMGTAVPFCINEEQDEPFPHNLELFQDGPGPLVPNTTEAFRLQLEWDETDWRGEALHLAWRTSQGSWRVGPAFVSGAQAEIPVDAMDAWPLEAWLCFVRDNTDATPLGEHKNGAFLGDIDVLLEFMVAPGQTKA